MKTYKALFFVMFVFFKSIRGDISNYTDDQIALKVALILSTLPTLAQVLDCERDV